MCFHLSSLVYELSQSRQTLIITKQLHALIIRSYLSSDPFYATKIIRFYSLNDDISSARNLFDKIPNRSVYLWNSMIRGYARDRKFNDAFYLFAKMWYSETKPDNYTFACISRACAENSDTVGLRNVHGSVVVSGLGLDSVSSSALVSGYSKLGLVDEAFKVFDTILDPDLVLWNSMMAGFGHGGFWKKCLELFNKMRVMGRNPDGYTLVGLLSGFTDPRLIEICRGIHGFCLRNGFDSNAHVGSSLVSMYSRCNCLSSAYRAFASLSKPDLVQWSALITGFSHCGDLEQSLLLFKEMNFTGESADPILIASVLSASARLAMVRPGKEIHSYVFRRGFDSDVMVASALIDMYTKCGFSDFGVRVFEIMRERNVVTYNSVISGLGSHGLVAQAFDMFDEMVRNGFKPDQATFSALLSTCSNAGFVKDGKEIFRRMEEEFGISAEMEHYVHMVKLLGMAGELEDACKVIENMHVPPDSGVLGALLSCCVVHGNSELGEIIAHRLSKIDPDKASYRVMLSNMYAVDGKWDDANKLRNDMWEAGLQKTPGTSWI